MSRGRVVEVYRETARRERAWIATRALPQGLEEHDAGTSTTTEEAGRLVFRATSTPAPRAPERDGLLALARACRPLVEAPRDVLVSLALLSSERRFTVQRDEAPPRSGRERLAQAEVRVQAERRGRRALIEGRAVLDAGASPNSLATLVRETREAALRALSARPAPRGRTTVVMGPGSGAALFHEVIGHPLEADFVAGRRSWFTSEVLARPLAIDELTIEDDPRLAGSPVHVGLDQEGTRARRVVLLDRGRLSGLLHDATTAALVGVPSNGHGRRSSWRAPARPRMTNTVVRPGKHRAADLVGSVRRGVYVSRMAFGRADFETGRFCMAAGEAFEIRNGRLGRSLADVHLEGDALGLLASVVAVGDDLAVEGGALPCDKDDEVWVGVGQPTVLLDGVRVG